MFGSWIYICILAVLLYEQSNKKKFGPHKLPQENHNAWNPANDIRFTRIPNKNRYLLISSKYGILIDYKNVKVYYNWLSCSPVYHRRVGFSGWCKILCLERKIFCVLYFFVLLLQSFMFYLFSYINIIKSSLDYFFHFDYFHFGIKNIYTQHPSCHNIWYDTCKYSNVFSSQSIMQDLWLLIQVCRIYIYKCN